MCISNGEGACGPAEKPPPFGHALKKSSPLDPGYVNLNNGTLAHFYSEQQIEVEWNPDRFHRLAMRPRLRQTKALLAPLVGADVDEIVFVPNVMAAINHVLRTSTGRKAMSSSKFRNVLEGIQYLADRPEHIRPHVETIELTFPTSPARVLDTFRARVKGTKATHAARGTQLTHAPLAGREHDADNRIVALIDAISSNPGVRMPWKEMLRNACREEGVWSVVDAAHSLGQEPDIDLSEARPTSGCPTVTIGCTRSAKRGCAILYEPVHIKSAIPTFSMYVLPSSPSEAKDIGTNFVLQHESTATGAMDVTPYLSVVPALAFRT
ncbi:hypothetical protein LXA43DRAFT_1089105 [Ganoderma leucocontextum]|nr:hypothetical protein LXA43DRAFT_1089105 [Ganoderma leucocontextum]